VRAANNSFGVGVLSDRCGKKVQGAALLKSRHLGAQAGKLRKGRPTSTGLTSIADTGKEKCDGAGSGGLKIGEQLR